MELRCPSCGGLLYSQRSRMCGKCGAVLPGEMVVTDERAEGKERQWARDLADKFATSGHRTKPNLHESPRAHYEAAEANPEELVRHISCATEFRQRKRRWVWILVGVQLWLAFLMLLSFPLVFKVTLPWQAWFFLLGGVLVQGYFHWLRASPICPNCKGNIRTCLTDFCHACGKRISHGRCTDCGVDNTWVSWVRPGQPGSYHWITFCPGCGVELDTWIFRWRHGRDW